MKDNAIYYQAVVLGGVVAALTDALPLLNLINCFCCLGIAAGGAVAVFYYQRYLPPDASMSTPLVVQLGLSAGIIGALVAFVFHYIMYQMMGNWQVEWILNTIENLDEVPPMWEDIYEELQKEEYQVFAGWAILIRSLILFPIFTVSGALITRRILQKRRPPMA
ncbi:MAG TPA: hypothetical protein ENK44_12120 [Caldithrix abyssi]|uniref:DUF4199 domain-containing protein n=1 Tax=Caldithrix abyssi TaxID=187145 RepID=A0A7V4WWG6_CALAY|nr:hypothetical protein [Caldithrix abyssi]